jgi:hypothetical protein
MANSKTHLLLLDIFGLEIFTYKPRLKYKPIQNFRPTLDSFEKKNALPKLKI